MADRDRERLDRQFERWQQRLPQTLGGTIRWLREPSARWVRIPVGILLTLGGVFSILPVLGIWMLPLGLLLLATDLWFLRRPVARAMIWLERKWVGWRRSQRGTDAGGPGDGPRVEGPAGDSLGAAGRPRTPAIGPGPVSGFEDDESR